MMLNRILKHSIIIGLFSSLFIPFIVSSQLYFPFITGKGFAFRILIGIVFFLWTILVVRDRSYLPKKSPLLISVSVFIVIVFFANLFGINRSVSFWSNLERMDGFALLIHLYMYFLVLISVFKTTDLWRWFMTASVVTSVAMSLYGFLQLTGKLEIHQGNARLDGTLGNATYLAIYLLFNIFFALYLLYKYKHTYIRIALGVAVILQLIAIFYTATRGALLGLLSGVLLSSIIISFYSRSVIFKKIGIGLIIFIITFVTLFLAFRDTSFIRGNLVLNRFSDISLEDKTTLSRFTIWKMAWEGFKERPLFGYGQNNFNIIFDREYDPKLHAQEQWFDRAHNVVFDWMVAGGALGLFGYLAIFLSAFYLLLRKTKKNILEKALFVGLLCAYFFQNLFVFDNLISYTLFFMVLAYIHTQATSGENENEKGQEQNNKNNKNNRENIPLISAPVIQNSVSIALAISMLLFIYFINVPALRSTAMLIKAVQVGLNSSGELLTGYGAPEEHLDLFRKALAKESLATSEIRVRFLNTSLTIARASNVSQEFKNIFILEAISELEKEISKSPDDARYPYVLGTTLLELGQYQAGLSLIERASTLSPNKQSIRVALPYAYFGLGQGDQALLIAKEVYEIEKNSVQAWSVYADIAFRLKRGDLVEALIIESVNMKQTSRVVTFVGSLVNQNPTDSQFRIPLALAYQANGQTEKAIEVLEKTKIDFPSMAVTIDDLIDDLEVRSKK